MNTNNNCWCFPKSPEFDKQYMENVDDKWLAKKSLQSVKSFLAGTKQKDYTLASAHVKVNSEPLKARFELNEMCLNQIQTALNSIATPCECD